MMAQQSDDLLWGGEKTISLWNQVIFFFLPKRKKSTNLDRSRRWWWGRTSLYRTATEQQRGETCPWPLCLAPRQPRQPLCLCCWPGGKTSKHKIMSQNYRQLFVWATHLFRRCHHIGRIEEEDINLPTQLWLKTLHLKTNLILDTCALNQSLDCDCWDLTRSVRTGCSETPLQEAVFAVHWAAAGFTSVQL